MKDVTDKRVTFKAMKDGTVEDYVIIRKNDKITAAQLPDRLIDHLKEMAKDDGAYQINRLDHVLQCATRAIRDGADDDWVVGALLHDIGDVLAPFTHGAVAAEILKPYLKEEVVWVVRYHGAFQMFYNKSLSEADRNSREVHKDSPYYQSAIDFCEKWDQCSFDPEYETEDLDFFVPIVQRVFAREPFSH